MNAPDTVEPTPGNSETVRHNAGANRYEIGPVGALAVAEYVLESGRMIFTHTFVPPELRGRGVAEKLVRFALDDARVRKLKIVPACSYVAAFIQRHPDFRSLVAIEPGA